jgi:hypothetical protein
MTARDLAGGRPCRRQTAKQGNHRQTSPHDLLSAESRWNLIVSGTEQATLPGIHTYIRASRFTVSPCELDYGTTWGARHNRNRSATDPHHRLPDTCRVARHRTGVPTELHADSERSVTLRTSGGTQPKIEACPLSPRRRVRRYRRNSPGNRCRSRSLVRPPHRPLDLRARIQIATLKFTPLVPKASAVTHRLVTCCL